jgi:predicted nucleic acid-binding protein
MADGYPQPVFLDTTVLSNFASTGAVAFLVEVLDSPVVVPAVRDEVERGRRFGHDYLATAVEAFGDGLRAGGCPREPETGRLRERLDAGEAEALRGAIKCDGTLATDDLAARRLADDRDVQVTGSVGLLVLGIERELITSETANEWLDTWRDVRGYYAPVERIEEVVEE